MNRQFFAKIGPLLKQRFVASCDTAVDEKPDLLEQADALSENAKPRIGTPMQFENLRNYVSQGSVNGYDGFRVIVQKQLNLNTVVSHFYWIGSTQVQHPIYQFRMILPYDEAVVNVATDMDFNVDGEIKYPVSNYLMAKTNFKIGEQETNLSGDLELTDDSSASQLQYSSAENALTLSYMQSIHPYLTLGGRGQYSLKGKTLTTAFGGIATYGENTLACQWDNNIHLMYLRKVNPNRVHLTADLLVDEQGNSQMTVGAEYTLKQSKVHMSVDSGMVLKSTVDSTIAPGVNLQFAAEMLHSKDHYKFGFGIIMG